MGAGVDEIVVVVPTRNRSSIAKAAIKSALDQPLTQLHVVVSDNSTCAEQRNDLLQFCNNIPDRRLRYIRPDAPLPMTAHWQWALDQVLAVDRATHFTFLTDRMIYKPGALSRIVSLASDYSESVITFQHDKVIDDQSPVRIRRQPSSRRLYRIASARLLYLVSMAVLHECIPRMLNCLVPRTILGDLKARFGSVFASHSPDFNFCFRILGTQKSILFYDEAILVHYAQAISNGSSLARGDIEEGTYADFMKNAGNPLRNFAAPLPEFRTVYNAIIHEYNIAKAENKAAAFPEVDMNKYLSCLATEVDEIVNPEKRSELKQILAAHGWNEQQVPTSDPLFRKLLSPKRVADRLRRDLITTKRKLTAALQSRNVGSPAQDYIDDLLFDTGEQALQFAVSAPSLTSPALSPVMRSLLKARPVRAQSL